MNKNYGIAAPTGVRSEEELKRLQAMLRPRAATGVWSQEDQSAYDAYLKKEAADPLSYRVYGYEPPAMVSNRARVESMQDILGVKVDGLWGPETQAAYDARRQEEAALRTQQARGERGLVPLQGGVDDGYVSAVPDGPMIPNQVKAGDTPTLVEKVYQGLLGVAQQKSGEAGRMAMMEKKTGAKEGESAVDSGKAAGYTGYSPYSNFQKYYDYGLAEEYLQNIPDEPEETEPVVPPRRIGGRPVKWTVENGKRVEVSQEKQGSMGFNKRRYSFIDRSDCYDDMDSMLIDAANRLNSLTARGNKEYCVNLYSYQAGDATRYFTGKLYAGQSDDVVVPFATDIQSERWHYKLMGGSKLNYEGFLHSHPNMSDFSDADRKISLLSGAVYMTRPDGSIYRISRKQFLDDLISGKTANTSTLQLNPHGDDTRSYSVSDNIINHDPDSVYAKKILYYYLELLFGRRER